MTDKRQGAGMWEAEAGGWRARNTWQAVEVQGGKRATDAYLAGLLRECNDRIRAPAPSKTFATLHWPFSELTIGASCLGISQ